jgi:hypothetical protein
VISPTQRPLPDNTQHSQETDIHAPGGIRNHNLIKLVAADLRIRSLCHGEFSLFKGSFLSCIRLNFTAKTSYHSQVRVCGICGEQNNRGKIFIRLFRFYPVNFRFTKALYSFLKHPEDVRTVAALQATVLQQPNLAPPYEITTKKTHAFSSNKIVNSIANIKVSP